MLGRSGRASPSGKRGSKPHKERRRSSRTEVASLWCDRGQVIDLSDRGIRISCSRRWNEGQIRNVTLSDEHVSITLAARCIWCRQDSLFSHTVGLAFDEVTDAKIESIRALAQRHEAAAS